MLLFTEKIANIVNRKFDRDDILDVVVSDLTYVNVTVKWNYVCLILDLFNREIIGYASGKHTKMPILFIKLYAKFHMTSVRLIFFILTEAMNLKIN